MKKTSSMFILLLVFSSCTLDDEWESISSNSVMEKCDCIEAYDIVASEILRFMDVHRIDLYSDENLYFEVGNELKKRFLKLNEVTAVCKQKFNERELLVCPNYITVAEKLDYIYGSKKI